MIGCRSIGFEAFLAKKWTAEKRFGLEGVEMLIPCMKQVTGEEEEKHKMIHHL